jgi:hypothetical protein
VVTVSVTAFAVPDVALLLFAPEALLVSLLEVAAELPVVDDDVSLGLVLEVVVLGEVVVVVVVEPGVALVPELLYAVVLGRSQPVTAAPASTTMATRGMRRFMRVSVGNIAGR